MSSAAISSPDPRKDHMPAHLMYGGVPVPNTASWSAEERLFIGRCPHAGDRPAICQDAAQGDGKPLFGKPHANRQREAIVRGLCDLCGKSLDARTKVSLSHAKIRLNGARVGEPTVMAVEPLLHRECAIISMRHCPSLRRDVREGALMVRQVTKYEVQIALMTSEYGLEVAGEAVIAAGHAKVVLLKWRDRDAAWLYAA